MLVALDDLHWADPETLALLRYVARASTRSRLLILGAYRDPDPDDETRLSSELLAVVRREAGFARIGVDGLSAAEVEQYVAAIAGLPAPGGLAQAVRAETGGNALYVCEIVRQLMEEGRLGSVESSGKPVAELVGVPAGVRELLARRVSRLSAEVRRVLAIAWAFSGGFEFAALAVLTELSEPALLDALDELLAAGLIRPADEGRAETTSRMRSYGTRSPTI